MITLITSDGHMTEIDRRAEFRRLMIESGIRPAVFTDGSYGTERKEVIEMSVDPKHGGDESACEQENCGTDHGDSANE